MLWVCPKFILVEKAPETFGLALEAAPPPKSENELCGGDVDLANSPKADDLLAKLNMWCDNEMSALFTQSIVTKFICFGSPTKIKAKNNVN